MKLITTADTLDFLGKTAPRPWVKRMLSWMIYQGQIQVFATGGRIVPKAMLCTLNPSFLEGDKSRDTIESEIRDEYGDEVADGIKGRDKFEYVNDLAIEWDEGDEIRPVAPGVIGVAELIDWEQGLITTEITHDMIASQDYMFSDNELWSSQFSKADFAVNYTGLCFSRDAIEMLSPGVDSTSLFSASIKKQSSLGRPRKWDWEGGIAHIVSVAQHPDGLPTGEGAQARIEDLLKDWFVAETGSSPAESQIRDRARTILRTITPKKTVPPF